MIKPRVCVLKTDGINRDEEMSYAFSLAGAVPQVVHVNQLRSGQQKLSNYQILAIPGGFSYGDDVVSGRILAVELLSQLKEQVDSFIEHDGLVFGVCNGFQVLIRSGLLPFRTLGKQTAALSLNNTARFECRWVRMRVEKSNSVFTQGCEGQIWEVPTAHGEGRLDCDEQTLAEIEKQNLVTLRFVDEAGNPTSEYPANPNGSPNAITGLTDPTGRIFGLMPHPECHVLPEHHPNWRRRTTKEEPHGLQLFKNAVRALSDVGVRSNI